MSFEVVFQFLFWATLIVLAIKFFLPDTKWIDVCTLVYGIAFGFICLFGINFVFLWLGSDALGIILAIGIGYTILKGIKTWDSWKK